MTKKFYKDWQSRIGETTAIYIYDNDGKVKSNPLFSKSYNQKIVDIRFRDDDFDIVIETTHNLLNNRHHKENSYKTFNRNDIAYVEFNK